MGIQDVIGPIQCGITPQGISAMSCPVSVVSVHQLASVIRNRMEHVLIIDSRSFIEHNTCHIAASVNVCCSKIVKRRLQQDKLSVTELLIHTCHCDVNEDLEVVVYDQATENVENLSVDSFIVILLKKLQLVFRCVNLLAGGFEEFHRQYPGLCEDKTRKCPALTSLSQPCLPIANQGPTRILPFLYLGSQFDAVDKELLRDHSITYVLNVSTSCPQPDFIPESHFMRIPVSDTYSEKLLPYFPKAFHFLDKVRQGNGCVLVHCLAGISRSPTVAIAYVMQHLRLSSDDGYRYVKSKRPTISPNFNFLGQLLEYEKQLRRENILDTRQEVKSAPPLCSQKRVCRTDMRTSKLSLNISSQNNEASNIFIPPKSGDQSPTTALAKLSFDVPKSTAEENHPRTPDFKQFRSKSCYGDWLRDIDETRKPKEMNVTTAPKVLSPVKEIKCDALISEISTGGIDLKAIGNARQKIAYGNSDEKHGDPSTQFSVEKYRSIYSSNKEERFSLQTLSHQSYSSSKGAEFFKSKQKANSNLLQQNEMKKLQSECSKKHISMIRSKELVLKKEQTESYLVFRGSDFQPKASSLHPLSFNVDSYKRSDSMETSGFGSESSDCFDNASESRKKPEHFHFNIDLEELEDDAILLKDGAPDRSFFPLSIPDIAASEWSTNLKSPLSPSESHLLEDLEMERDMCKTEPSSPRGSSLLSEDPDSFHDSGVTISPGCVWPRKRVANFDARLNVKRDKLKYEHFTEIRTWWFPLQRDDRKSVNQFSDSGLYRVQSCPGMLSHTSSNTIQKHSHFCSKPQERISHESCPDVGRSLKSIHIA